MPWEKLFALIGVAPVVMVILVLFWKGDDALAGNFRADIAEWLKQRRLLISFTNYRQIVQNAFHRIFGAKPVSIKFFMRSSIVSVLLLSAILIYNDATNYFFPTLNLRYYTTLA